jgi:uncharacterized membrane protein YoaK (UPF0700 family)
MTGISAPVRQRLVWVLLLLTAVTGMVDAVSFLRLGTIFVANMTGNVIFMGFALAGAAGISLFGPLVALPAFLLGALGAGRLAAELGDRPRTWLVAGSAVQTALLGASAALAGLGIMLPSGNGRLGLIAMLAFAMGIQNALARRLGLADLTTTVLTLTLTGLASESAPARGDNPRAVRRTLAVLAMLAGALAGALLILNTALGVTLAVATTLLAVATSGFALAFVPGGKATHVEDS